MKYNYEKLLSYQIINTEVFIKRALLKCIGDLGYDLTFEQWTILAILKNQPGLIQSEIAKISAKDKTNVTRILDVLEKKEYIERFPSKKDRRSISIQLSELGQKTVNAIIPHIEILNHSFHQEISENDYAIFLKVLKHIGNLNNEQKETL